MESSFLNTSRSLQPTKLNLNAILYQQPLYVRCATITHQIRESSSKELHHFFPHLLSNIFGYDQTTGWCLKSLHPTAHKDNHTAVMNFLHVKGPIFELIGKLESEGYIYEFPVCHLPAPTQDAIHSGATLPFFTIRDQDAIREGFVLLNAFEYYVCHFAYYLVHTRRVSQQWTPLVNCCYSLLVNEYLSHFLPPWDVIQPSNPPSPSPTRRVSSPVTTHQQDTASWQQCPRTPPGQHSPSSLGLLKMSSPHHRRTVGGGSMQLWKSEVFVQILIDFWLNQSQYEIASHFDVTQDEFKPSEEHCRIVRMMMKNIHYFANGGGVVQSLSCPALAGLTDNLRRSIIPLYVQSRMYCFLHHALEHWTFDVVYRYVLELWLTYIQPWRYTDPNQPQPNANGDNEKEAFHIGWYETISRIFWIFLMLHI
jgi:sphingomyelin phosphodiesterase 4